MVLPSYSIASQFLDPLSYQPSINLERIRSTYIQKVDLEAEGSRQAPAIRVPMFRAVRCVALQALALEVLRTLSMVAWTDTVGLVVVTVVAIVGLALAAGVMAAVAAALLLADIGVADILTDC